MSRRPTEQRREEIVGATLELLADHPVDRITTRAIAERVGLTQPALFVHFESREEIFQAVIEAANEQLRRVNEGVLGAGGSPMGRLELLILGILKHVEENPGIPRLLFFDSASAEGPLRQPLGSLLQGQRLLLEGLIREARSAGEVPEVDATEAAFVLQAWIQGLILSWQIGGRARVLLPSGRTLLAMWRAGMERGLPAENPPESPTPRYSLMSLDVRSLLNRGEEPFPLIMQSLQSLATDGVLQLRTTFRPGRLLNILSAMGLAVEEREHSPQDWTTLIRGKDAPLLMELSELPAPEPLEAILKQSSQLAPGGSLLARVPKLPKLLLPHLDARGLAWETAEEPEGSCLVSVRRTP